MKKQASFLKQIKESSLGHRIGVMKPTASKTIQIALPLFLLGVLLACKPQSQSLNDLMTSTDGPKLLYVASGACYAGGAATLAGASTVSAFDLETGLLRRVVIDYNSLSPGDSPVAIADFDADYILVLVENTSGRRIDKVAKAGNFLTTYLANSTALNGITRGMAKLPDNSLLISKSTAIEKFSSGKSRVLQGANPYVSAPAGACATTATLISSLSAASNNKILYTHAAATPNNKIVMVSATGYSVAGDCLTSHASPTTLSMPTSSLIHSSGKLLVSFGSTTAASNSIYAYNLDVTANSISSPTLAFQDTGIINGPSAMTEDPITGDVFVANGSSTFNTIERFQFNPSTRTLSHATGPPFLSSQIYTRCVSDMKVLNE